MRKMARTERVPETSMEEILASIRRIITEDSADAPHRSPGARAPSQVQDEADDDIASDIARALEMAQKQAAAAAAVTGVEETDDDILELAETGPAVVTTTAPSATTLETASTEPSVKRSFADELSERLAKLQASAEDSSGTSEAEDELIGQVTPAEVAAPDANLSASLEDLLDDDDDVETLANPLPDDLPLAAAGTAIPSEEKPSETGRSADIAVAAAGLTSGAAEPDPSATPETGDHEPAMAKEAPATEGPAAATSATAAADAAEADHPAPQSTSDLTPPGDTKTADAPSDQSSVTTESAESAIEPPSQDQASAAAAQPSVTTIAATAAHEIVAAPAMQSAANKAGFADLPAALLEEKAAEMLKPLLREWLDANMPRILAKAMSSETSGKP